jgi:hypothetical protein
LFLYPTLLEEFFPDLKLGLQLYFKIVTDLKLGLPAPYLSTAKDFKGFTLIFHSTPLLGGIFFVFWRI